MAVGDRLRSTGILIQDDFAGELIDLISRSGECSRIIEKIVNGANMIMSTPPYVLCRSKNFEILTSYKNLYSMHVDTKEFNLRILYSYVNRTAVLLHVFNELDDKAATGYVRHAPIAITRRDE